MRISNRMILKKDRHLDPCSTIWIKFRMNSYKKWIFASEIFKYPNIGHTLLETLHSLLAPVPAPHCSLLTLPLTCVHLWIQLACFILLLHFVTMHIVCNVFSFICERMIFVWLTSYHCPNWFVCHPLSNQCSVSRGQPLPCIGFTRNPDVTAASEANFPGKQLKWS